ncbi:EXLDI protein [Bifidobacterium apousia]|uniref:EXLDI protein n=1 Tax=Bifidobacterium apousia TaxID=2750996 RepID=UPI0018DE3016|nr:EXLDI protein [Bifidobacterium apousia]MBI0062606.1 EXLDI protein [Bifidobacterium apousia]
MTEAAKYAESLSAAVVLGLRLFIDSEKEKESGNKDIELIVLSNGREIIKRFEGKRIFKSNDRTSEKRHITEIFLTKKKKYVLYERIFTDWSMIAEHATQLREDPSNWYIDFPEDDIRKMSVYESLDQLKSQLPNNIAQKIESDVSTYKSVEVLDI